MKVRDLIEKLEEYDGELEVVIASQPSYPMEYGIAGVVSEKEMQSRDDEESDKEDNQSSDKVYLVEGNQHGYSKKDIWNSI